MRLDGASGDVDWVKKSGGPGDGNDRLYSILIDDDGNPIATGVGVDIDESADFVTIKYDGTDGSIIWERRISGAINNENRAGWLGLTAQGDVIMANRKWVTGESFNVELHRYSGIDGSTMWMTSYNGAGSASDDLRDMRLDSAGNPIVVGVSEGNMMALRFDATDGDLLWDAFYDGPMGWYDMANCVAFDPTGNVLIGGYTDGGDSFWDATTVAYELATGAELWNHRFDGDDSLTDEVGNITLSDAGDLYVCGSSYSYSTDMDILAMRFEFTSTGVPGSWDIARATASYPNPFKSSTTVRFAIGTAGDFEASVFDVQGRLVRRLSAGTVAAGDHPIVWDGNDGNGAAAPSGLYFVRVRTATENLTGRVLKLD